MAPKEKSLGDYETLSLDAPKCISWASTGGEGSGKSAYSLGAPEPIFVCAFDPYGMNRVGREFKTRPDGTPKDIRIARYPFNPADYRTEKESSEAADETWQRFSSDYMTALKHARTVLWDREDLAWEALRWAKLGSETSRPSDYSDLNREYVGLIQRATKHNVNLGLLRGLREEWVSRFDSTKGKKVGENTGKLIPDGMKKVPDHVDLTLLHWYDETERAFKTRTLKFPNAEERLKDFENLTWLDMALMAYSETSEEDWQ